MHMGKRIDDIPCHCLKIRRSAENVTQFYDKVLAPSGITARQCSLLGSIYANPGCSIRELAEDTILDRSTLTRSLKPLLELGYIEDRRQTGARNSVLKLTEQGTAVYREAYALWKQAQQELEQKVGKRNLAQMESMLLLLQDL